MGIWCRIFHGKYWSRFKVYAFECEWGTGKTAELPLIHCSACGRIGSYPNVTY